MKSNKLRIGLVLLLFALAFSALTLIFWNFARDAIVTPIYYLLWLGSLVLNGISQGVYLAFLLLVCVALSLNILERVRSKKSRGNIERTLSYADTRYLHWRNLCANLSASDFSRNRFISDIRQLILALLANEYDMSGTEVETLIIDGKLAVPKLIRNLIEKKEIDFADDQSSPSLFNTMNYGLRLRKPAPDREV